MDKLVLKAKKTTYKLDTHTSVTKGAILFERIPDSDIIQFSAGCGGLFFATQLVLLLKLTDSLCHSRAGLALSASRMGGNPLKFSSNWIPVFTGMTKFDMLLSNSYLRRFSTKIRSI